MKVFTVGLDEKTPPSMIDKSSPVAPPPPPPVGIVEVRKTKKTSGGSCVKALIVLIVALFLALLLTIAITELAWNRARDENYFRLRWEELKQRVSGGYEPAEPMGRSEASAQQMSAAKLSADSKKQPAPVVVMPAAVVLPKQQIDSSESDETSKETSDSKSSEQKVDGRTELFSMEPRLNFLRSLMEKIREHAADALGSTGNAGTVEVSLVAIDPPAIDVPQQQQTFFGPFGNEMQANRIAFMQRQHQPQTPNFPFLMPLQNIRMGGFSPVYYQPWPIDEYSSMPAVDYQYPEQDYPNDDMMQRQMQRRPEDAFPSPPMHPSMRITHHFGEMNPSPQKIVTEMFGRRFERLLHDMMVNRLINGNVFPPMSPVQMNVAHQPPQTAPQIAPMHLPFQSQSYQMPPQFHLNMPKPMIIDQQQQQQQRPPLVINNRPSLSIDDPPHAHQLPFDQQRAPLQKFDRGTSALKVSTSEEDDEAPEPSAFNMDMIDLRKPSIDQHQSPFENVGGIVDNVSGNTKKDEKNVQPTAAAGVAADAVFPQFQPRFPVINANHQNWWAADAPEWNPAPQQFHAGEIVDQPMP